MGHLLRSVVGQNSLRNPRLLTDAALDAMDCAAHARSLVGHSDLQNSLGVNCQVSLDELRRLNGIATGLMGVSNVVTRAFASLSTAWFFSSGCHVLCLEQYWWLPGSQVRRDLEISLSQRTRFSCISRDIVGSLRESLHSLSFLLSVHPMLTQVVPGLSNQLADVGRVFAPL